MISSRSIHPSIIYRVCRFNKLRKGFDATIVNAFLARVRVFLNLFIYFLIVVLAGLCVHPLTMYQEWYWPVARVCL